MQTNDHLRIDAQVIWQLGSQLITDAEQALLELIKNSYDADATKVTVVIDPEHSPDPQLGFSEGTKGLISVEDDGDGLSEEAIRNGWLVISLSPKRLMKQRGQTTGKGRTPQGDKGLGRLGTMKLGKYLILATTHKDKKTGVKSGHRVFIDWEKFEPGVLLDQVLTPIERIQPENETRTSVKIYGLSDITYWLGDERRKILHKNLSTLISPFEKFSSFKINLKIGGVTAPLDSLSNQIRATALTSFRLSWTESELLVAGRAKLDLLRPNTENEAGSFFEKAILADNGDRFFSYLQKKGGFRQFDLKRATDNVWYIDFSQNYSLPQLQIPELAQEDGNPGPFHGELDHFNLDQDGGSLGVFSNQKEYRDYVRNQAGLYIYRDNFGVRMPKDWAGLGKSWTSGRSYYGLKPSNTVGYIAISAAANPQLTEKSDREGFLDTPASRAFVKLVEYSVKVANDFLTFLRRSYVEFRHDEATKSTNEERGWSTNDLSKVLQDIERQSKTRNQQLEGKTKTITKKLEVVQNNLDEMRGLFTSNATDKAKNELGAVRLEIDELRIGVEALQAVQGEQAKIANVSLERIVYMSAQLADVYETVGVGIAAQALAHDMNALLEDLLGRTQRIGSVLQRSEKLANLTKELSVYVEYVLATISNLRKQLAFLQPMLRGTREVKQEFSVAEFLKEYINLREDKFSKISIKVSLVIKNDFTVHVNRGRLLQVVDNLVRNSEYWLQQHRLHYPDRRSEIRIEIDKPRLLFEDNGPGVRPALEETLFDVFVTDKPKREGQGHGLGLYIVSQLLARDNSRVWLGHERNEYGNRYQFLIDLSGMSKERP